MFDTNAYTKLLSGDRCILELLSKSEIIYISVFVLGELYTGFNGGKKKKENIDFLERFLSKSIVEILNATKDTAMVFGFLKNTLKENGTPIPINDLWIAAHTLETGSVLVSYDKHFQYIENLRVLP